MEAEDVLYAVLVGALFGTIVLVMAGIRSFRAARGRRLVDEAHRTLADGDREGALERLKQALWKARQSPDLERRILADIAALYRAAAPQARPVEPILADYDALIAQVVSLSQRDTHKASSEILQVQAVKRTLLGRLPPL